jgi:uncharacterized protein (DUF2147 family)
MTVVLFVLTLAQQAPEGDALLGLWRTEDDKSTVEVYKCGDHYCGKIVALKFPFYPPDDPGGRAGQVRLDDNNADAALRDKPLVGVVLMRGFQFNGNLWRGGTIYDPENGKTYKAKIRLTGEGQLKLRGYIGNPALGRTSIWRR